VLIAQKSLFTALGMTVGSSFSKFCCGRAANWPRTVVTAVSGPGTNLSNHSPTSTAIVSVAH